MRDPLRNVSVRFKLAFAFLGVGFLAFGVGGFLVSRTARASLEREILSLLSLRSQFHATTLEGDLRTLGRRVRDFASDGFIRNGFEHLDDASTRTALREHLQENKLPLEVAFMNLALAGSATGPVFLADPQDASWTRSLPAEAFEGEDWFSDLLLLGEGEPPSLVITTRLTDLAGERVIGRLLARVHVGRWIAAALGSSRSAGLEHETEFLLGLSDHSGRRIEIPPGWVLAPPAMSSSLVQDARGLRIAANPKDRAATLPRASHVLSESFPIALNGWSLETQLDGRMALAAVSGLQAKILVLGLVLASIACLLLLFPMQFLARPIRQLHDAAIRIREGDFSARVPVDSTDEIGELSGSFNLMAEAVEEQTQMLSSAAKTLEQRKNELRMERDLLNAVIHSMRDGLVVLDPKGAPEIWNAAAEPLLSIVRDGGMELRSHRNCLREQERASSLPDGVGSPCMGCLFEPSAPPRSCLIDAGSSVFEIHSNQLVTGVHGRSGRVLVAREVTHRIAEDERQIHQERLAVLGEVAAVMAHELNNPLAAIRMFSQLIESKLPEGSPLKEDFEVIERNTQACTRTIRELLDYATGATPEVGPVDVHASLREVASFLRALRERKDSELELQLEAADPIVIGDEVQLRQVFVNLVLNALQAVGDGRVTVRTALDGSHLVVDVSDTGPGIPDDVAEMAFRPFYTTKPRGSGTGLGLPTARRITEIQGGGLDLVDARPGRTTFRVRLLRDDP